jgi:hypothetical protein
MFFKPEEVAQSHSVQRGTSFFGRDTLFDGHFPLDAARFDVQEELAGILGHVGNAAPCSLMFDGYFHKSSAHGAVDDHSKGSRTGSLLIGRFPTDSPLAASHDKRISPSISAA